MNKKSRIMTVVGTRPELIRMSQIIKRLDRDFDHILVHTGQNYDFELYEAFLNDLEIRKPDYFLNAAGKTAIDAIGNMLKTIDPILEREAPKAFVVLGDTNSCLTAIAAKRRKIPIFHLEAGNRCFDMRVPEEINRKIVDHIADVNLTYSEIARTYLIREGIHPASIVKIGSPMLEVIKSNCEKIEASSILKVLNISKGDYFVASIHREENILTNAHFDQIIKILNKVAGSYEKQIIMTTHPRTKKFVDQYKSQIHPLIRFQKPLNFSDYIALQKNATAVISDSGTITEESSILDFPAVNLRESHERPEGDEQASVMLTSLKEDFVLKAIELTLNHRKIIGAYNQVQDYNVENVSFKVARLIQSYTEYVNRNTWREK